MLIYLFYGRRTVSQTGRQFQVIGGLRKTNLNCDLLPLIVMPLNECQINGLIKTLRVFLYLL